MNNSRPVYSTDKGRLCAGCGKSLGACQCKQGKSPAPGDGIVRIKRETKGRGGKGVSLITGLSLPEDQLKEVARTLKQLCGTGGTVKDGVIEIQGDNRDRLLLWFQEQGYQVKKAGG